MSEWYKDRKLFPSYINKEHPLYEALEFYHEDEGTVIPHGKLIECDLASGYIKYVSGEQTIRNQKHNIYTSTRGPWRCRWRPDKVIKVEDKPVQIQPTFEIYF